MHEFALADAVMRATLRTAEAEDLTVVTKIVVRVGELQRIERELFAFALKETRPPDEPRIASAEVVVEIERARFVCRACRHAFALDEAAGERDAEANEAIHFVPELAHAFLRCPSCGSPDFAVRAGRGVSIVSIEGDRDG